MDAPPLLSDADLAATPPAVLAFIYWQSRQIALLTARVAELEAKLGKNSGNSSKPPSTSHPHDKPAANKKKKSNRKPGGQPGRDLHLRPLLPPEECQEVIPCVPTECRRCGSALAGVDAQPLRHQVWELPEIKPIVTEYQQHRLVCSCGCSTCGELPKGVPTGQAGPRLIAFAALLMANFRQSKRRAAQFMSMILNQPASPGWLVNLQNRAAEAIKPAYDELAAKLADEPAPHIDESPTKQGPSKAWVWTFVAATFTFFACRTSRAADVLKEILGNDFTGTIHCDRARMYWCFGRRLQWCWAHLIRDFQALIDSPCHTKKRLGHDLMKPTKELSPCGKKFATVRSHALDFANMPNRSARRSIRFCCAVTPTRRRTAFAKNSSSTAKISGRSSTTTASTRPTTPPNKRCVTPSSGESSRSAQNPPPAAASSNACSPSSKPAAASPAIPTPGSPRPSKQI